MASATSKTAGVGDRTTAQNSTTTTTTQFRCSVKELKELMEVRGVEGCRKIEQDYGTHGVAEICRRLCVVPTEGECIWPG